MFNGARNVVVEDGVFVVNGDTSKKVDIGRLIDMVAPNAILNAGGRADDVKCFPGTREEIIGKVEKWISCVGDGSCKRRIMWLSGPAGAGKSAICQTIAERCPTHRQQAANFFFFRGDPTRKRAEPLVATLVYQLRDFYPMLDELLTNCLKVHPLIGKASIADQFFRLIASPIQTVQQSSSTHETILLIIDGLDECDDLRKQDEILTALRALVNADHSPFVVLIASRAEPNLIMSFNQLGSSVESIFLSEEYRPEADIRLFVAAKFDEIRRVHHLRDMLSEDWPAKSDIDAIVDKSSGQFIYAATAMRFIQHSYESPDLSLSAILEMQLSAGHNPLAQLDAIYSYIFSKVRDMHPVKVILCTSLIIDTSSRTHLPRRIGGHLHQEFLQLIGYKTVQVKSLLANLGAVVRVDVDPIKLVFYHASLYDYLKDKRRSGDYHLDIEEISAELSLICLREFHDIASFNAAILPLQYVQEATLELSALLLHASRRVISNREDPQTVHHWNLLIENIERLVCRNFMPSD